VLAPSWALALLLAADPATATSLPKVADDRLVFELLVEQPQLVTPIGLTVDERGRVWVIENHTHQRTKEYRGPESDRVRIFSGFDGKGRAANASTFADGFRNAMSLALGKDGTVFLATRAEIYRMTDKDGVAGDRKVIVKLETAGTYPHNGLAGFAFDGMGDMYFSLGENLGAAYKLIGSDGTTLSGGGEGGSIYACRPDGSKLRRVATGFWNTFHLAFDTYGRLFAVDNDPDSRGPCRFLHIVPGGDYGYRFRYGRKGLHPFDAWNGELPGTLPMVAGTGEAPSGIVAYESNGLPAEYRGDLLATSWGDHVIERFHLEANGASFRARAQTLVRGGENFRPVGVALGPDGAVYFSDWVDKSYPVHGKGRLWRLRMKEPPADDGLRAGKVTQLEPAKLRELLGDTRNDIRAAAADALAHKGEAGKEVLIEVLRGRGQARARLEALWGLARLPGGPAVAAIDAALTDDTPELRAAAARLLVLDWTERNESRLLERALKDPATPVRMEALLQLRTPAALKEVLPVLADKDPFLAAAALDVLGRRGNTPLLLPHVAAPDPRLRLGILLALRRTGDAEGRSALPGFLKDPDPEVRRTAIQWVGEEGLKDLAPQVSAAATQVPTTRDLFLALLATNHLLAGGKPADEPADEKILTRVVQDPEQPAIFRLLATQSLRPDNPALSGARLLKFLSGADRGLRQEAARTLALRGDADSQEVLRYLASDDKAELDLRAMAVASLAQSARVPATQRLLLSLLAAPPLRRDALRSLREALQQPEVERQVFAWWDKLDGVSADEHRELAAQLVLALGSRKDGAADKRLKALAELAGPRPKTEAEWRAALDGKGDPVAGERLFYHSLGARCFVCHRVEGRGGKVGPDLSTIGRALSRDKLIESILTPSKEIAPQFTAWSIATSDGKVRVCVIVEEGFDSTVTLADNQGKLEMIKRQDIEERHALPTSIMPDNLPELMTRQEFLDLLAFLEGRK
jgi:putative membrane-bound dehydrogenase-like protein